MNNWTGSSAPYCGMVKKVLNSNGYPDLTGTFSAPLDYLFNEYDSTTEGGAVDSVCSRLFNLSNT